MELVNHQKIVGGQNNGKETKTPTLFVFSIGDSKQNSGLLLTPASETVFRLFYLVTVVLLSMVALSTHSSTSNQDP